jgi:hypothetical protein
MRRTAMLALALAAFQGLAADDKGTKVDFDGLTSMTPDTWVKERPPSTMRFAQFRLPKKGEDKEDAEVVIFAGFGGTAKANVDRWKGQFKGGTEGKVTEAKVAGCDVTRLEISGTWTGSPTKPGVKAEPKKDYKGVFYQFEGPEKIYHIRLIGPAKTVDAYVKGYDEWVSRFKK